MLLTTTRSVPVFEALYLLVTYGYNEQGGQLGARLDPPADYFRVR